MLHLCTCQVTQSAPGTCARTSAATSSARKGERVVVTERNRPIAVLAPLPENEDPLARLIAEGKVIPAEGDLDEYLRKHPGVALDDPYAGTKALEETREETDYGV